MDRMGYSAGQIGAGRGGGCHRKLHGEEKMRLEKKKWSLVREENASQVGCDGLISGLNRWVRRKPPSAGQGESNE